MNDTELLSCATELIVSWCGERIYVSRYDNHGHFLKDGRWGVCSWKGGTNMSSDSTNPHYLGSDGVWRYKNGTTWASLREALDFLTTFACKPETHGWRQRTENPHEKVTA